MHRAAAAASARVTAHFRYHLRSGGTGVGREISHASVPPAFSCHRGPASDLQAEEERSIEHFYIGSSSPNANDAVSDLEWDWESVSGSPAAYVRLRLEAALNRTQ